MIIGGGFIGVEFAEQLAKFEDKKVSLIEMEKYCLSKAFSEDVHHALDCKTKTTQVQFYA